jgi:hypothetical protein
MITDRAPCSFGAVRQFRVLQECSRPAIDQGVGELSGAPLDPSRDGGAGEIGVGGWEG